MSTNNQLPNSQLPNSDISYVSFRINSFILSALLSFTFFAGSVVFFRSEIATSIYPISTSLLIVLMLSTMVFMFSSAFHEYLYDIHCEEYNTDTDIDTDIDTNIDIEINMNSSIEELLIFHFKSSLMRDKFKQEILKIESKIKEINQKIKIISDQRSINCNRESAYKINKYVNKITNELREEKSIYEKKLLNFRTYLINCITNEVEINKKYKKSMKKLLGKKLNKTKKKRYNKYN